MSATTETDLTFTDHVHILEDALEQTVITQLARFPKVFHPGGPRIGLLVDIDGDRVAGVGASFDRYHPEVRGTTDRPRIDLRP